MGTRSTIKFINKRDDKLLELVTIYQQFDGYLEGVGHELATWLCTKVMVNGLTTRDQKVANGAGCLAAQFISFFKTEPGDLYIVPSNAINQDYNYEIIIDESAEELPCAIKDSDKMVQIKVTCFDDPKPIFEGSPLQLLYKIKEEEDN